jgi:hypothetical protein
MHPASEGVRFRVLSLYPHPRYIGHVVLAEDGLVPGAAFSCRTRRFPTLKEKIASLERRVADSIEQYEPTVIVIVRAKGCAWLDAMMNRAVELADATGLPLRIRYEAALANLFVDDGVEEYDKLGQCVTTAFFPELASGITSWGRGLRDDCLRHRRSTWKAAAGAVAVLAEMRPETVRRIACELPRFSASRVNQYLWCGRKYAFRYVEKIEPESRSAAMALDHPQPPSPPRLVRERRSRAIAGHPLDRSPWDNVDSWGGAGDRGREAGSRPRPYRCRARGGRVDQEAAQTASGSGGDGAFQSPTRDASARGGLRARGSSGGRRDGESARGA